jgi:translation initiation factor 2 subunit 2
VPISLLLIPSDHFPFSAPPADEEVEKMTDMFSNMAKKKKKPSKPKAATPEDGEEAPAPAEGGEFDASTMKKKKKKSSKPKAADDSFEAKLAKAGVEGDDADAADGNDQVVEQEGDPLAGTGIWAHNTSTPISYSLLLNRFFTLLNQYNPDILSSGSKSYKIPPPQCLREGNKKTIFANIAEICKRMKRSDEHVTQFLFAELGTSGSVDGSKRLVIKGRFQQKQIENVLRRYIGTLHSPPLQSPLTTPPGFANQVWCSPVEYVTCKTCRSPDTELNKGENRLYFVTCNSCGSRRSVTAIKSGFTAQIGKRKRMNG